MALWCYVVSYGATGNLIAALSVPASYFKPLYCVFVCVEKVWREKCGEDEEVMLIKVGSWLIEVPWN